MKRYLVLENGNVYEGEAMGAEGSVISEIVFTTEGGNATPVYGYDNEPLTVANLRGTGVYLFWYEGQSRYLQLATGNFA